MTQPNKLPATLPIGTRTRYGNEATSELTLDARAAAYMGHFVGFAGPLPFAADVIDWGLVAVQAATPADEDRPIQAGDWVKHKTSDVRYQVTFASMDGVSIMLLRPSGSPLGPVSAAEFERVDGPHPMKDEADWCDHCGESAGCAENCVTRADEPKPDPYREHAAFESRSEYELECSARSKSNQDARERLEAALRREAERPRGNRADAIEFAKAHPWEEFE